MFNLSPTYRRSGGRLIDVSEDLKFVKIKLPLNYKTRNYVGTHYGGYMYSCVDGIYVVQLIHILGAKYVVWDRAASIRFKEPGNQTLYAEFLITDEILQEIASDLNQYSEKDVKLMVYLKDKEGSVYAEIEKMIYIASKEHYRAKKKGQV